MSAQDSITERVQTAKPSAPKRRWYRRWWAWCLWILLTVLILLMCAGLWAWTQRYSLMESVAIDTLADAGFEAELDIISVTKTNAVIRNIRLRSNGADVLRAEELRAAYVWPDVREGIVTRVELDETTAWINLGEDWTPRDTWLAELLAGNGDGGGAGELSCKRSLSQGCHADRRLSVGRGHTLYRCATRERGVF